MGEGGAENSLNWLIQNTQEGGDHGGEVAESHFRFLCSL